MAAAFAQEYGGGEVVTPGGVRIEPERVYVTVKPDGTGDKPDWRDPSLAYAHGNATLRLRLTNTNATEQTVRVQLPLAIGGGKDGGERTLIVAADKFVGGDGAAELDIPVPMVGRVSFGRSGSHAASRQRVFDDEGDCEDFGELGQFGYGGEGQGRNLYSPSGRNVASDPAEAAEPMLLHVAITPSAGRFNFAEAHERAAKSRQELAQPGGQTAVRIELPDFARFRRWQDLSVYDMIAIDEDDWEAQTKAFKAILPDWVAAGGTLAFIGTGEPPMEPGNYGLGRIAALGASSPDLDSLFKTLVASTIRHSLATSPFDCDIKASDAIGALRNETPFTIILVVLLAFCILAGPVLAVVLAKSNRRISLLWLFPVMAVVFSLGVMGVIVCVKGIDPELRQFVHTIYDEKAGKVVTICNHVILAPFSLQDDIRLDAKDSVVAYMCGDVNRCGDAVLYTGGEFVFRSGWAPTLWPVVFRTVSVRGIADAPSAPPVPIAGNLQVHYVSATEERRAGK